MIVPVYALAIFSLKRELHQVLHGGRIIFNGLCKRFISISPKEAQDKDNRQVFEFPR